MIAAAREDEQYHPACWIGTVVSTERKALDVTVLTVRTEPRLEYLPGQSVAVQAPGWPGCGASTRRRTRPARTGPSSSMSA